MACMPVEQLPNSRAIADRRQTVLQHIVSTRILDHRQIRGMFMERFMQRLHPRAVRVRLRVASIIPWTIVRPEQLNKSAA